MKRPARDIAELATFPLMVRVGGQYFCRGAQRMYADGSIEFACAMEPGMVVTLAEPRNMVARLEEMFGAMHEQLGATEIVIGFDCAARTVCMEQNGVEGAIAAHDEAPVRGGLRNARRAIQYDSRQQLVHLSGYRRAGLSHGCETQSASSRRAQQRKPTCAKAASSPRRSAVGAHLRAENAALRKTVRALMARVERAIDSQGTAFSWFQAAAKLEETVRQRTEQYESLNVRLKRELESRREIELALKQAKQQADLANQSKTRFLAAASHDLRQPLNSALLFLESMDEQALQESRPRPAAARTRWRWSRSTICSVRCSMWRGSTRATSSRT